MVTAGRRDRAQLILVAAIAVAFIVLGLVVAVNGVLYTQTVSSGTGTETTTDVGATETELERGIQGLLQRENLAGELDSDALNDTVGSFATNHSTLKADQRPAMVGVRVNGYGEAVLASGTAENETRVVNATDRRIGYFVLDVDSNQAQVETDDDGGFNVTVTEGENDGCELGDDGRIDLVVNATSGEECDFGPTIDPVEEYGPVVVELPDDVEADYEIVTRGDEEWPEPEEGDVEFSAAVWNVTVTTTYDSNEMTSNRTGTIELYEGEPYHAWPHGGDDE